MSRVTVIIPSLNPDEKLMKTINGLLEAGFGDIVVVNDGSDEAHKGPFEEAAALEAVTLLSHGINRGKGRALKTAFDFCIKNRPDIDGVVTADGDNQHLAKDIAACADKMSELKDKVVLGVRDFSEEQVPARSRAGNRITSAVFAFLCGIKLSDTQTGLRAIPAVYLPRMLEVEGERFEYETEMLLMMKREGIDFYEQRIDTVYIEKNETSHFNTVSDSWLVYKKIFAFTLSSLASAGVDFLVYSAILLAIGGQSDRQTRLLVAAVTARIISSVVNFFMNRKGVFRSKAPLADSMKRYYILCVCQLAASYGLLYLLSTVFRLGKTGEIFIKIPVDLFLFVLSFQIQNRWVFKD